MSNDTWLIAGILVVGLLMIGAVLGSIEKLLKRIVSLLVDIKIGKRDL